MNTVKKFVSDDPEVNFRGESTADDLREELEKLKMLELNVIRKLKEMSGKKKMSSDIHVKI